MNAWMGYIIGILLAAAPAPDYIEVDATALGTAPEEYVGVPIKLKCRFVKLDPTWLNDQDVFRSSDQYLGFMVEAADRIFAQLFFPRRREEEVSRFRKSDRLIIYGKVISAKHNFPWIDVDRISEGWVIGEESEEARKRRIETAKNYEEFLLARSRILQELNLDDVRDLYNKQEALIQLFIQKGIFTLEEFNQALARQKAKPTPVPPWEKILKGQ